MRVYNKKRLPVQSARIFANSLTLLGIINILYVSTENLILSIVKGDKMPETKIIQATIEEAYLHGLRFKMSDIAKKANISKTTLYDTVLSKKDLINKVLDYLIANFNQQEQRFINSDLSTREQVSGLIQLYIESFRLYNRNLYFDLRADYQDEWNRCMSLRASKLDCIISLLQNAIQKGELRSMDVNIIRQFIVPAAEALFDNDFLQKNQLTYKEAIQHFCEILFHGMSVK